MKKIKNIILNIVIIILIVNIGYFTYQIYYEMVSNKTNNNIKAEISKNVSIQEESSYNVGGYDESKFPSETIAQTGNENITSIFNPQDTVPSKFIYADFEKLKAQNKDTVAWLWVPGTKVNYSVTQTIDNSYYLTNNFNKEKNQAGWIFGDFRSNFETLGRNSVIYGHNQLDLSMFGDLGKLIDTEGWFKKTENKFIYLSTEKTSYVFKIISVYISNPNSEYIQQGMLNDTEYQAFLNTIVSKNEIKDISDSVNINDKILTLSTCKNHGQSRLVVTAKLVKYKNVE